MLAAMSFPTNRLLHVSVKAIGLALVVLAWSSVARAQLRFVVTDDPTTGAIAVEAPSSFFEDVHVFTTFGYSKGAYHNAATVTALARPSSA